MDNKIPSQVMDYKVYNGNNALIGTGEEIKLPTVGFKAAEVDLPGGSAELPSMRTDNLEMEVPFRLLDEEAASVISLKNTTTLHIRGAMQKVDSSSHDFNYNGLVVTVKGFAKEIDLGTLKRSDKMDSKVKLNLTYIKVADYDGTEFIEIDKLNGTLKINGEDARDGIDKYL